MTQRTENPVRSGASFSDRRSSSRGARSDPIRTRFIAALLILAPIAEQLSATPVALAGDPSDTQRWKLDNGVIVLARSVPDVDQVAVIALYKTGFADEPAGMTQAAHLAEHLRCFGSGPGVFEQLNEIGSANAETLPTVTYYDYAGPADRLEEFLRTEANRLRNTNPTRELILQEATRCYQETDIVERYPAGGMLKHAFMAFYQAWNHGRDEALVRDGLENLAPDTMRDYLLAHHDPSRLTLVIVGGVEPERSLETVRKHIGSIPSKSQPPRVTHWNRIPREHTLRWDARPRAVCIAYEPPDDPDACIILSLAGTLVWNALGHDEQLRTVADAVAYSTHTWPVGRLPFFAYATAKPGTELPKLRETLQARLDATVHALAGSLALQIRMQAGQLAIQYPIDKTSLEQTARRLPATLQNSSTHATRLALGNAALQMAMREAWLGEAPAATLSRISAMSNDDMLRIINESLKIEQRFVTYLEPIRRE
jgi:predicted Zn-dependent peptidase